MIRLFRLWWRNWMLPSRYKTERAIYEISNLRSDLSFTLRAYQSDDWRAQVNDVWVKTRIHGS